MPADLYLRSAFEKNRAKYRPEFYSWVARRDALQEVGRERAADAAHEQVEMYYDKMYERGYFRDTYDNFNLLRQFDLSWWGDVYNVLTDRDGTMTPKAAEQFLQLLAERESAFEANLEKLDLVEGESRENARQYFRQKYEDFRAFLREAIDRDECIDCSL